MDCTPTFKDLLDSYGLENFCQDQMETVQLQQVNECELQSDNNSSKRKQDFASGPFFKTPTKVISSNLGSTNPWMLDPKHGNKIPRLENQNLYHYPVQPHTDNSKMPILEANPMFPYPEQEAFGHPRQLGHKFQSVYPHRNETYGENSRLVHGQSFITNIFQPDDTSDFPIDYTSPLKHDKTNALRCIENDPQVHCKKLQKGNALYGLTTSKTNPYGNKWVENEKILNPSVSQKLDDSKYGTRNEIKVDKEIQLAGQNKLSSTVLVSESGSQNENRKNILASPYNCNFSGSIRGEIQNVNDKKRIVMNHQEGSEFLNEARNTIHTSERLMNAGKEIKEQMPTQQKKNENHAQEQHVEKTAEKRNKNAYDSAEQENIDESTESTDESSESESTDESAEVLRTDESAEVLSTDQSAEHEDAEKRAYYENAEKAYQGSAEQSINQKNVEKSANQKNVEKSANQKNVEKSANQMNTQENSGQNVEQKNGEKNVEQENSKVFTGKGYDSIEDFIQALYNNTLYKRY